MAMSNTQEEEQGYELGSETKKRLEFYNKGPGKINKGDVQGAQAAGMSADQMQSEYDEYKESGGRIGSGAQARMGDFNAVSNLEDFDPSEIGGGVNTDKKPGNDIRKIEMAALLGQAEKLGGMKNHGADGKGFSATEVNNMMKEKGYTLSSGAQNMLNKHLGNVKGNDTLTDVTDPGDGTPVLDTSPPMQVEDDLKDLPVKDVVDMVQPTLKGPNVGSNIVGNQIDTTIGDGNNFYGNVNNGILDQSVNIAGGSGGDGNRDGAMGLGGGGVDNFASAATTNALLENILNRRNENFSSPAQRAIAASANQTGASQRVANLDYQVRLNPLYNEAKATELQGRYLGDLDSMTTPDLVPTADPEKYETDFDEIANKYKI